MLIVTVYFFHRRRLFGRKREREREIKSAEQTRIDVKFIGLFIIKKLVIKRFVNISTVDGTHTPSAIHIHLYSEMERE